VTERPATLWRHRDFRSLWAAETVSQVGTQVTLLALPLAAILVLDASPFEVGLLSAAEMMPFLLIGLPAGAWVDRMRRRPVMVWADLGRGALLATVPIAHALDVLTLAHLVAFLNSILTVFFDVAYQSYLPSLVGREHLIEGNSKLEVSRSGAQIGGPAIAGALIELVKAPIAIAVDAASFLLSAFYIGRIAAKEPPVAVPEGGHGRIRHDVMEGLKYVGRHPYIRPITACTGISNFASGMIGAAFIVFASRELGMSAGVIGAVFAVGSVGYLLGTLVAAPAARRFGLGRTIVGSTFLTCFTFIVAAAPRSTPEPYVMVGFFFWSIISPAYNINQVSLRQSITPDRMLGRMNATIRFVVYGTIPLGALLAGMLGSTIGLRPTLYVAAAIGTLATVPVLLSPVRGLRDIESAARQLVHEDGAGGGDVEGGEALGGDRHPQVAAPGDVAG
jgi:MFS family permease